MACQIHSDSLINLPTVSPGGTIDKRRFDVTWGYELTTSLRARRWRKNVSVARLTKNQGHGSGLPTTRQWLLRLICRVSVDVDGEMVVPLSAQIRRTICTEIASNQAKLKATVMKQAMFLSPGQVASVT